jgi:GT2 family glycosyltransferase
MGYKQIYVPESIIYHKVSGERQSTFKLYYSVRSRLLLIREGFGGISGLVASAYFLIVISLKLVVWRLFRPDFFKAASAGLVDYFKGNFGQGRGTTLFPDSRTTVPTRETPVTLTSKGPIGT